MTTIKVLLFAIVISLVTPAHADTVAKSMCSKQNEKRFIEIQHNPTSGGCVLLYTKFDVRKRVANSLYSIKHCETVKSNIEQKLTESGFACAEPKSTDLEQELAVQRERNLEALNSRNPASE